MLARNYTRASRTLALGAVRRSIPRKPTVFRALRFYSEKPNSEPKERVVSGVDDEGKEQHGFDPLKPRKPLSRVSIGSKQSISQANNPSLRATWLGALVVLIGGGGLLWFFKREKRRIEVRNAEAQHRGVGTPRIGGPFSLKDQDGNLFSDKDLIGKFSILYFGFSMCPDVCPEELEILADVLNDVNKHEKKLQPIFVTCDPARDSPEVLKEYLADFHPDIIGLTGTYEEIKDICKQYRVYFSTPPNVKPGQQYLVDHSIFFYLMDPEGHYIDVLGRNYTSEEAIKKIKEHLDSWRPEGEDPRSWFQKLFS